MDLKDKIIVVTGAASGIGRAIAQRFHAEGATLVVCADRDEPGVKATALPTFARTAPLCRCRSRRDQGWTRRRFGS